MLKKCTETDAGGSGAFVNLVSKPIFYATDIQTNKHTKSHMEVAPPPKNNFFHGSTCKVDKRGSFGAQNTSLTLKIRKKGFSRLHRAQFFKIQRKFWLFRFPLCGHVFATEVLPVP